MPDPPITRKNHTVVGVDLGIKHLATLSTGEKFDAPKPLVRAMKKLIRLQRQLNRKQKGSNNRNRARMRVARLYYQITCVRADALHKLTTLLVQRYSTIVLEDLNVQEMLRNNKLARAIADVGFGEFRRQVEYKASPLGASVIMADRWYPSSKLCANCGHKLEILLLSTREWACPQCGVIHDRDVNAARNLEQLGRATPEVKPVERGAMARSRGRVKLRSKKQEPTGVHQCTPER
jgi:putative transposase